MTPITTEDTSAPVMNDASDTSGKTSEEKNNVSNGIKEEEKEVVKEEVKPLPPKPPISRNGPTFPMANQFRGPRGGNNFNKQRPGRAAGRGR